MTPDQSLVYLNGHYQPLCDAKISVLDRGFLFGDGVYEVIPSYRGRLFYLDDHLSRLAKSLNSIRMTPPHSTTQWSEIFQPLLDPTKDQYIYLQITRGVAAKRDHSFSDDLTPTIFVMSADMAPIEHLRSGTQALTIEDTRWHLCNVKATTLLANVLLRQEALDQQCTEAILIKNGLVLEGAASNIFVVKDGVILTPPQASNILPGITRKVVIELIQSQRIPFQEVAISTETLDHADEIWLTSSTREIIPVTELNSRSVSSGTIGPMWHRINTLFQEKKAHD